MIAKKNKNPKKNKNHKILKKIAKKMLSIINLYLINKLQNQN